MDVVGSEEESSNNKSLVERLEEAPHKIFDIMAATSKNYLTHMIGVVKSYLPHFNLAPIAKGISPTCSDEKFRDYCKESEVTAEEILKNMAEWTAYNNSCNLHWVLVNVHNLYPVGVSLEALSDTVR